MRDRYLVTTSFMAVKILIGKLFFRPWKVLKMMNLEKPEHYDMFKENCVVLGYCLMAAYSEVVFELFKLKLAESGADI